MAQNERAQGMANERLFADLAWPNAVEGAWDVRSGERTVTAKTGS